MDHAVQNAPQALETKVLGYSLIEEVLFNSEIGEYQAYGILFTSEKEIIRRPDISRCKDKIELIIARLNEHQLHPLHIDDIIEDMVEFELA